MEQKCIDRQYHVQDNVDVSHKYVKMYYNKNQFPTLPFCGPHFKPHVARGMSKHYHLHFYPKLGNGVCAILHIPCACVACTSILDKPWIYGIPSDEQERYDILFHQESPGVFNQMRQKGLNYVTIV